MPYIPPEVVEQARQIDLLTYLRKLEPDNVEEVKGTRNVYRTVDHDSLKMSNDIDCRETQIPFPTLKAASLHPEQEPALYPVLPYLP